MAKKRLRENYFTPKYKKKKARVMQCTYPGCSNTFKAFPHARFCEYHKDPDTREKPVARVEENTMFTFKNDIKEKMSIERACDCCGKPYRVDIYPGRTEYPRFCEDHRSEYRRKFWRETHKDNKGKE